MLLSGPLQKMSNELSEPIRYWFRLGDDFLHVNQLIGKTLRMTWLGEHRCFCGHIVPQVHARNFCRECFFTKPEASMTIMKPELSQAHLGIEERDLAFEQRLQLQPHYVYLAKTNQIKVGVTRKTQMPYRWIDQGAASALLLLEVPNRYMAGQVEVLLKEHFVDKTSWRDMLKNEGSEDSLLEARERALQILGSEWASYAVPSEEIWELTYPVAEYPKKVSSLSFKEPGQFWEGTLQGIRGQYLITSAGVFNVRSHEGYIIELDVRQN